MGKARHNGKNTMVNLETLCLDCGRKGFAISAINSREYYEVYSDECPICKRNTKHIKCKNLDELKSKLEFCDREYGINNLVLDAMKNDKQKIKTF